MTQSDDIIRVLRTENIVLRNRIEFLEAQLEIQHNKIHDNRCWDIESASECCHGEIDWEHPEYDYYCTICRCETEAVSVRKDQIKRNLNYDYNYEK